MENPFQILSQRLSNIETLLIDIKHGDHNLENGITGKRVNLSVYTTEELKVFKRKLDNELSKRENDNR